jgi:hypothetical protein
MKISADAINTTKPPDERRADEQKTSYRFSQLLKNKGEERQGKEAGDRGDGTKRSLASIDMQAIGSVPTDNSFSRPLQTEFSSGAAKVAQPSTSIPPQLEQLTLEISHQIDVSRHGGKTEGVNITFDSNTLNGLQVQIRPQEGEMAIRFVTRSENISNLLSKHSGELREALTGKGVKIRDISITSHGTPEVWKNRHASA